MRERDVAPLIAEYTRNKLVLSSLLAGFGDGDMKRQVGVGNRALWILGHLAATRLSLGRRIGLQTEAQDWEDGFGMGSSGDLPPAGVTKEVLLAVIDEGHDKLMQTIAALPQDRLDADTGRKYPGGGNDVYGMISFLGWHEAYHLGQLAFIRSCLGKARLA